MSFLYVIQIQNEPVEEDNLIREDSLYEDELVSLKTDYVDGKRSLSEVSGCLSSELSPIASLDTEKRTITFKDDEKLEQKLTKSVDDAMEKFRKTMDLGMYNSAEYHLRKSISEVCGIEDLFYYDGYAHSASQLIADRLSGGLPETVHVGAVIACHF